jgi:hypothetical protein
MAQPFRQLFSMLKYLLIIGLVLLSLGLLWPLGQYARRQQEPPGSWISALVLIWSFLWLACKYAFLWGSILLHVPVSLNLILIRWAFFLLLSLVSYLLVWRRLRIKGKINLANRISEIGRDSSPNDSTQSS